MMTNTTVITSRTHVIITSRTHVINLPHNYINNRNYTTNTICNLFLTSSVHNNKSSAILSCLKSHDEINIDNVFNTANGNDDDDDGFTAGFDLSHIYMYSLGHQWDRNDLVISDYIPIKVYTHGVGSKFKLALGIESGLEMSETIGMDLVAMNFNNIVSCGAQPTLFLTPYACPRKLRESMKDISLWCASRCGFPIRFSDIEKMKSRRITSSIGYGSIEGSIITTSKIEVGDVLIGLPSNGVHSHGFFLVKRVIEQSGSSLKDNLPGTDITLGESLMTPTPIYVKQVLDIISKSKGGVNGIAYIDNGGFIKNIGEKLRIGLGAVIYRDSWPVLPIFEWIQKVGNIEDVEMRLTFNMGIGMVFIINKENAHRILQESCCNNAYRIGEVVSGDGVTYR